MRKFLLALCTSFVAGLPQWSAIQANEPTHSERARGSKENQADILRLGFDSLPTREWAENLAGAIREEKQRCERGEAALKALRKLDNTGGPFAEFVTYLATGNSPLWFRITYDPARGRRPEWSREFLGNNEFERVQKISAYKTETSDETLANIGVMTRLEELEVLNARNITDEGFTHLANLHRLRKLYLGGPQITDAGLAHVAGLHQLKHLNLLGTKVAGTSLGNFSRLEELHIAYGPFTDEGLAAACHIRGLRELDISNTEITDAGLKDVPKLSHLSRLSLTGEGITDEGLARLSGMVQLESLSLGPWGKITDVGMSHLGGLKRLKYLSLLSGEHINITDSSLTSLEHMDQLESLMLSGQNITDDGLENLVGLKKLRFLDLLHTKVTPAGVSKLRKSLPKATIWRS